MRIEPLNSLLSTFEEIKLGECFIYFEEAYLKLDHNESCDEDFNAFCFSDGTLETFEPGDIVMPIKATLFIELKGETDENK